MATTDDDLMSSPDPLNDSMPSSLMRRMTRSQQSKQFMSLGGTSVSPRRQTFALEVGDNRSPQKLFVTVESEQQQQSSAVRRRLFASPTPKKTPTQRRGRTTTTTIPLRDPSDDEGISAIASATPKKRGRPRKFAPTPVPAAASKKRVGTPARKGTPGRPRKNAALTEEGASETSIEPTPRPSRTMRAAAGKELASDATVETTPASSQSKRGAKRKAVDETPSSAPALSPRKRGRPRKKPLVVEEVQEVPEEHDPPQPSSPVPSEPSPAPLQSNPAGQTSPIQPTDNTVPPSEGDIWMDTLSNEATPRPAARSTSLNMSTNTADLPNNSPEAPGMPEEADEYAPMVEAREDTPSISGEGVIEQAESEVDDVMLVTKPVSDAASEAMSEASHPGIGRRRRDHDTIAQSEEFSMIFMDSVRSLHPDFSAMANASAEPQNEIGDSTNQFINKTLESIKNGMQSEQGDGTEHSGSDRSASGDDQQDRNDDEQREERASSHYEMSQQGADVEPEVVGYDELEEAEEVAEEYQTRDHSSYHEVPEQERELGSEHYVAANNEDNGDLAEESRSREESLPQIESYPQDMVHGSAHVEGEDQERDEYETQAPDWDADEPEVPASQLRHSSAEPQPETSPTKRRSSPWWSVSPRRTKGLPLGRQLLSFKAMQSHSPSQVRFSPSHGSRRNSANPGEESNLYEDSFSEIPEAVLEAATPRPQRTTALSSDQSPAVQPEPQSKDAAASAVSGATDTIRSDASRMLTPEETPSPTPDQAGGSNPVNTSVPVSDPVSARSKSASPARVRQFGQSFLAPQRPVQDEVTPVGPASSPQLPALQDANAHRVTQSSEHDRRLTLSPIVRAGLALQSVTSDQSSPLGPKTLGSPFKASTHSTPRRGSAQPSREVEQTAEPLPNTPQQERMPSNDDSLRQNRRSSGHDSFMRALDETAQQMQTRRTSQANSALDTTRATVNDADEMSWIAEDTVPAPMPQDTVASRSSSMAGNFGSVAGGQNSARNEEAGNGESDDEDIWVTEAQRPTPKQPRQQAFGPAQRARRTLLPNTWRRNAQTIPATKMDMNNKADQSQEYSLLSQQSKEASVRQGSSAMKQGASGGLDLSKFFSSPTVLPNLAGGSHPAEKNVPAIREAPAPARTLPSNSMFPAIPQKDFQPSPVRRSRLFSSAASASAATSVAGQQSSPIKSAGANMAEQQPSPSKSMGTSVAEQQPAPSTPERPSIPVVPQKQNFTPRRGHGNQSLFAPPSARSSAPTPPQMQLSRNDIERWQEETSLVLNQSDSPEVQREPPGPLPHRTMSPSKSCLRSPLKPRTPGRVVEFAGPASPLQEARARAANANANARRLPPPVQFKPPQPKQVEPIVQPMVQDEDKENSPSDVSMSDATPQKAPPKAAQKSQVPEGLSQKVWSGDHWRLLDTLLQLRRKGPFPFDLKAAGYVRRDRGLEGKVATSGSESMEIEKWHVDVVDAFRAEVGGWDEGVLAKRVFALVVGEMKRYR